MINFVDALSSVAIVIFIFSALPQIWTLFKNKSAKDISLSMALLIAAGNFLMLVRSASVHDIFFLVNYAFQLALWLIIIVFVFRYRSKN